MYQVEVVLLVYSQLGINIRVQNVRLPSSSFSQQRVIVISVCMGYRTLNRVCFSWGKLDPLYSDVWQYKLNDEAYRDPKDKRYTCRDPQTQMQIYRCVVNGPELQQESLECILDYSGDFKRNHNNGVP